MTTYIYDYDDEKNTGKTTKADHEKIIRKHIESLPNNQKTLSPLSAPARGKLTTSFWGQAWVQNIRSYEDLEYRIDRGRSYLRRGAVIDLRIEGQQVHGLVAGLEVYEVSVHFKKLADDKYLAFKKLLNDQIHNTLNLLAGEMPDDMVLAVTHPHTGLFPRSDEISFSCTCLDYAHVCKHAAAILYGIALRFDQDARLFFSLRGMDNLLLSELAKNAVDKGLDVGDTAKIQELFDIDIME